MQPKSRKRKRRVVVDTNVVVAGISGFRDQYIPGRIPSADLLHRWADEEHFVWLYSEDIPTEYKEVLKRLHVRSAAMRDWRGRVAAAVHYGVAEDNSRICMKTDNLSTVLSSTRESR